MEFLKGIYGDKALTYEELLQAINAHNGDEANKDNQIKIGNLGTGEYISAAKHKALQDTVSGKDAEIANANNLIAELQKASKGNEEMQQKFKDYETANAELQKQLQETELKYAFDVMLMDAGVTDKDDREFLAFKYDKKLKEEGKSLELDDNKKIKDSKTIIDSLKTTNPKSFESAKGNGAKVYENGKLPDNEGDRDSAPTSLADALKMEYEPNNN